LRVCLQTLISARECPEAEQSTADHKGNNRDHSLSAASLGVVSGGAPPTETGPEQMEGLRGGFLAIVSAVSGCRCLASSPVALSERRPAVPAPTEAIADGWRLGRPFN
jgi:hypothetical protein